MGRMKDLDILLTEATTAGEAAGRRMNLALERLIQADSDSSEANARTEIRAAAADLYDAAVDLPIAIRAELEAANGPEHTLDDVWADVQTLLERTAPEIRTTDQPVTGVDDIIAAELADPPEPSRYGVRLTFSDDSGADYDDVTGVQVYDKVTETFPFGFLELEAETTQPDGTKETTREYRPGFWKPEDGEFVPFSAVEAPAPNGGW